MAKRLSRRDFLKMAATGAAAVGVTPALAAYAPNSQDAIDFQLSMVDYSDPVQDAFNDVLVPAFMDENPGSTIEINWTAWDRYNEEMTTAFAAGVTPDVFQGGAVWAPQMARRNWSFPLTAFLDADEDFDWADYPAGIQDDVTINGEIVGIPYRLDLRTLWYRQDMVEAAGFDAPPTNWDEFLEVAQSAAAKDGDIFSVEGYHFSTPTGGWQRDWQPYLMWVEMAGGQMLSDDLTHSTLAEEPAVNALQFLVDLVYEHQVMSYPGLEQEGDIQTILSGKAAMTLASADVERNINLFTPEETDNVLPALPMTGEVQATHAWVNKFFISSQSRNTDRAWDLLRYLTRKDNAEVYSAAHNITPPRQSLIDAEYMTEKGKVVLEAANYARTFPKHWRLIELFRPITQELEQAFSGLKSPQDALTDASVAVDAIIAEDL